MLIYAVYIVNSRIVYNAPFGAVKVKNIKAAARDDPEQPLIIKDEGRGSLLLVYYNEEGLILAVCDLALVVCTDICA